MLQMDSLDLLQVFVTLGVAALLLLLGLCISRSHLNVKLTVT